jgi:predicted dehydrogenase
VAFSPNLYTHSSYFPADERIDIVGTRGMIQLTGCTGRLVDEAPLILYRDGRRVDFDDLETDWQASFTAGIRDFPLSLHEGRDTLISAQRALDILKFAYALIVAARTGKEIRPDQVTDELVRQELGL